MVLNNNLTSVVTHICAGRSYSIVFVDENNGTEMMRKLKRFLVGNINVPDNTSRGGVFQRRYGSTRTASKHCILFLQVGFELSIRKFGKTSSKCLDFQSQKCQFTLFIYLYYSTYYRGLKFLPLGFKRLVILQSVHKMKINLSSLF